MSSFLPCSSPSSPECPLQLNGPAPAKLSAGATATGTPSLNGQTSDLSAQATLELVNRMNRAVEQGEMR